MRRNEEFGCSKRRRMRRSWLSSRERAVECRSAYAARRKRERRWCSDVGRGLVAKQRVAKVVLTFVFFAFFAGFVESET